jgi:hypothetical protein
MKEFQNNRNYRYNETWNETEDGCIHGEKVTDDGLGTKKTENYEAKRENDEVVYEVTEDIIDKVGEN